MSSLLLSAYPFWAVLAIVLALLVKREQRQARKHDQACADLMHRDLSQR